MTATWLMLLPLVANLEPLTTPDASRQWAQWRGPLGTGVAPHADPPTEWSEQRHVRWKVAVPGRGHATPIVWDRRVFLTTSLPHGEAGSAIPEWDDHAHNNLPSDRRHKFMVLALDRDTGRVLWQKTLQDQQPHEGTHETGTWASNSSLTDGQRLYAYFGSRGLFCMDFDGRVLWQTDFGDMQTRHGHGEGSSPALHGDTLVVNWDHEGDSFIVALNTRDGRERWRAARDEMTSWSTPLIVDHGGQQQVVVAATGRVRGYDLKDGRVIWECGGLSRNVVASPVAADGFVYVGNSYDWQAMMGIRLDAASGDITDGPAVAWKIDRHTPYVPSPLLYGDQLLFLKHNQAFVTCLQAQTGKPLFGPKRLPGLDNIFASPVGAAGRVYIVGRSGTCVVLKHGASFEVLARNELDESFSASPAIVGRTLFLRGEQHLYCLAE